MSGAQSFAKATIGEGPFKGHVSTLLLNKPSHLKVVFCHNLCYTLQLMENGSTVGKSFS